MDNIDPKALDEGSDPSKLAGYLAGLAGDAMAGHGHSQRHAPGGATETVREDDYEGHHIIIRTTYRIEVDGRVHEVPLMVDDEGNLHCHSLPNYLFGSAVELVRQLIDTFPNEFGKDKGKEQEKEKEKGKEAGAGPGSPHPAGSGGGD
jgi:hypothetical protein